MATSIATKAIRLALKSSATSNQTKLELLKQYPELESEVEWQDPLNVIKSLRSSEVSDDVKVSILQQFPELADFVIWSKPATSFVQRVTTQVIKNDKLEDEVREKALDIALNSNNVTDEKKQELTEIALTNNFVTDEKKQQIVEEHPEIIEEIKKKYEPEEAEKVEEQLPGAYIPEVVDTTTSGRKGVSTQKSAINVWPWIAGGGALLFMAALLTDDK